MQGRRYNPQDFQSITRGILRIAGAFAMAASLSACAALRGGEAPEMTGDSVEDVNWSFADAAELRAEVDALRSENAELKQKVASLQRQKAAAAAAAEEAVELAAGELRDNAETNSTPPARAPAAQAGGGETVVAAANPGEDIADAKVPVAEAPRLVQPSFTSGAQEDFQNEAPSSEIKLSSVLYGVHLASYRQADEAREGWRKLQRENPDELGLLEPRIERISVSDKGVFIRLIGGGFSSKEKAETLCDSLKAKGLYCAPASFDGERLSLADANSG